MRKAIDLTGKRFGRLTVIKRVENGNHGHARWLCQCECGNSCVVNGSELHHGKTKSCGCLNKELLIQRSKKYNEYHIYNDIVFVKFTNCNEYFICDLDDWGNLKDHCWMKSQYGYAMTNKQGGGGSLFFHRLIVDCPDGLEPDHKYQVSNGVCDNRKSNLKVGTHKENMRNTVLGRNNTSGHKGISLNKKTGKWEAYITIDNKRKHLGLYEDIEDAIKVREEAELKYFGKTN